MALIQCNHIDLGYSQKPALLQNLNLSINAGECHRICGATGSGKSSLLMLLADLFSGPASAEVIRQPNIKVGLVMQDPNVQFIRQRVGAEVAFALENMAIPSDEMPAMVEQALTSVGLSVDLDIKVNCLSLGQKYRLMIASQLVYQPDVLLLDEPGAQLDQQGINELTTTLKSLSDAGLAIVIVEHDASIYRDIISHHWYISAHKLLAQKEAKAQELPVEDLEIEKIHLGTIALNRVSHNVIFALQAPPFKLGFTGAVPLFHCDDALTLAAGELALLIGDNGTGKSSFLKALAGIQSGLTEFPMTVLGHSPKLGRLGSQLGLLLQSPSRQLFESSVLQELEFGLRRFKLPLHYAQDILDDIELSHLAELSPHQLSYGQQHLIAMASIACLKPKLLLLDDPFAGLDEKYRLKVYKLMMDLARQGGAVLVASHKTWPDAPFHHQWLLKDRSLQQKLVASESSYEC